jgi:flagellar biosynthesis chaperone FliJ
MEKTSSLGSLVLKNGLLQLPSAMINTKQHIISPNRLDISTQTAIMTYFNGLTAVAGKYREINPFDSIDSSVLYPTRDEMVQNPIRSDSMVLSGEESDSKDEDDGGDDFSKGKGAGEHLEVDLEANLGNVDKIDNLGSKNGSKSNDNDSKTDNTKKDPIRDSKSLTNRVIISHFEHQETHLNTINDAICEIISNQGDLNEQVGLLKRVVIASGEQIEFLQNFIENLNILNKKNCKEFNEQKNIVQKQNEIIFSQQKQINALLKLSGLDSMRLDGSDVTGNGSGQGDRDMSNCP